ncbi:hypothetical protein H0E87_018743 [Populus deltoides]|uniref:Uncharacterized protein n=1 Tax=Populus deltoides TaxID=3696 RepID=A0A8T2XQC0_POPDE|nr:hypothetical protein H0E87_018743 [Populus deltoides]
MKAFKNDLFSTTITAFANHGLSQGAALFKIEPDYSGNHVLLSDINAAAGSWDHVAKVRAMTRENRVKKNRSSSR